ncbi:MAG: penicillin-insensitive murein endopeptidase [Polyangiales bacterium]|nr:penicillin-insensitive murein endopeptidase [Sandaracinaceae bacterium]
MRPQARLPSPAFALIAMLASLAAVAESAADLPHPHTREELEREQAHAEGHGEPTEEEQRDIDREIAAEEEARAQLADTAPPAPPAPPPFSVEAIVGHSRSISMGTANRGLLRRGVPMPRLPVVRVISAARGEHFGTAELVTLIVAGAEAVSASAPGSQLVVGDLSREGGGRIRPHQSHRSGRDVDLGFYVLDHQRRALPAGPGFVSMSNQLMGTHRGSLYAFDVARNWTLVEALLTHPDVQPQYIFVANPIIAALLAHARRQRVSADVLTRAEAVMRQPRGSPHRSHFHLRIFCPRDDVPSCEDDPPFYPWTRRTP